MSRLAIPAREEAAEPAKPIRALRDAEFSDSLIVEIVAVASENIFTHLVNLVANKQIEFPVVRAQHAA